MARRLLHIVSRDMRFRATRCQWSKGQTPTSPANVAARLLIASMRRCGPPILGFTRRAVLAHSIGSWPGSPGAEQRLQSPHAIRDPACAKTMSRPSPASSDGRTSASQASELTRPPLQAVRRGRSLETVTDPSVDPKSPSHSLTVSWARSIWKLQYQLLPQRLDRSRWQIAATVAAQVGLTCASSFEQRHRP